MKGPGFNPRAYEVKNRFQAFAFKCNLYRYNQEPEEGEEGSGAKLAYVLMPLIDAFNHRNLPKKTEFEFSSQAFRLRSPAAYANGDEVLISYGVLGNDELAVRYGRVVTPGYPIGYMGHAGCHQ
jgi:hypothetical protein